MHALNVCLKKTHVRVFFVAFFSVRFVAKRYVLQQKCLNGQIQQMTKWDVFETQCIGLVVVGLHVVVEEPDNIKVTTCFDDMSP